MLNQKYRFHSRGGVRCVYQHGKTVRQPKISLIFADNPRGRQRFAVVVSKKVFKHAVDRNRVRRRLYEAIRLNFREFAPRHDYIIVVYSGDFKQMPFADIEAVLRELAERARETL